MALPRKILYVHYQASTRDGSHTHTSAFAASFGKLCREKGIDFSVLAPPPQELAPVPPADSPVAKIKNWLARFYLRDIKRLLQELKRYPREKKFLQADPPDLVIMRHDGKPSILWAAGKLGIPLVAEINAPDREAINAHYRHIPGLSRIFSCRHTLARVRGAYTVSSVLADHLRSLAPSTVPIAVVPNGADPAVFDHQLSGQPARRAHGIPSDAMVIGFVGSFLPWHGVPQLFEAFEKLLSKTTKNLWLMLVGQRNQTVEKLLQRAADGGYKERVVFTGHLPRREIPQVVAAFDIAVMPNSNWYGSPLKLFEYMAMAKAVAMVDTPPIAEVLRHEQDGLLFPANDVDAMADTLLRLAESDALRERLGKSAHRQLCEHYTWDHNAEQVMALVEQVWQTKPS